MTRTMPIPMRVASRAPRTFSSPGHEANIFDSACGSVGAEDDGLTVSLAVLIARHSDLGHRPNRYPASSSGLPPLSFSIVNGIDPCNLGVCHSFRDTEEPGGKAGDNVRNEPALFLLLLFWRSRFGVRHTNSVELRPVRRHTIAVDSPRILAGYLPSWAGQDVGMVRCRTLHQ